MPGIMKPMAGAPIGIVEMADMTKEHHNTRSENFNKVISMANNRYLLDGFEMDIGESKCSMVRSACFGGLNSERPHSSVVSYLPA
jgi:hypothetical protein